MSEVALATCKCGEVRFDLIGPPIFSVYCCCNDCIVSEHYVNKKANFPATARILAKEALRPEDLPQNDGVSVYEAVPDALLASVAPMLELSKEGGNQCLDDVTRELIECDWEPVTEVCGKGAYEACGFMNVKMD
jgi:hypothetical protein